MRVGLKDVLDYRASVNDSFHFNWSLEIHSDFQHPFDPTHKNIASLQLNDALSSAELAANLRRIFSAIVSGNVKDSGIKAIKEHGKFEISGDKKMMVLIDKLLSSYVEQQRMKLPGSEYIPCYKIIND